MRTLLAILLLLPLLAFGQGDPRSYDTVRDMTNRFPNEIRVNGKITVVVRKDVTYPGGIFFWDSTNTLPVNFTNIFPSFETGRWVRASYHFTNQVTGTGTGTDTNAYITLIDSPTITHTITLTNITSDVRTNSLGTNYITTEFYDYLLTLGGAADGVGHGTNIFQDGVLVEQANLVDSAQVAFDTMGSSISASLPTGSISTNKIDANFHSLLTTTGGSVDMTGVDGAFRTNLNIITSSDIGWSLLGDTNAYASINYENIQEAVAAMMVAGANMASITYDDFFGTLTFNASAGGGGTNSYIIGVNGSLVNSPNLINNASIAFGVSGSDITATVLDITLASQTSGAFLQGASGASGRITVSGSGGENSLITIDLVAGTNPNVGVFTNPVVQFDTYGRAVGVTNGTAGGGDGVGMGTNLVLNGELMQPAIITNNLTAEAGRVLWVTNASGHIRAYATNLPAGGSQATAANGTALIPFNLIAGAGIDISNSAGSNAIVSATGSLTNGFTLKSATGVMASNTVDEVFVMSVNVPAGTLSANGDELEIYVPGIYTMYTGSTNVAYSWQFYVNAGDSQGIQQDVSPLTFVSSPFAVDWTFRFKRMSSTTFILTGAHRLGGDDNADRTNIVDTLRVVEDDLGTTPDFDTGDVVLELSVSLSLANVAHHMRTYGYTVWKVGGGGAGALGDPGSIAFSILGTNHTTINIANGTYIRANRVTTNLSFELNNAPLTAVAALTSGTSTNFYAGDGTFKQVTTNMIPGLNSVLAMAGSVLDPNTRPVLWTDFLANAGVVTSASLPLGFGAIGGGTQSVVAYETNHPGIVRLTSNASNTNSGGVYYDSIGGLRLIGGENGPFGVRFVNTNGLLAYFGYHDTLTNALPVDAACFMFANGYLLGVNLSNSVPTYSSTSNQVSTNVFYRWNKAVNTAGTATTFTLTEPVAGTVVWTDTVTGNVPMGARTMGYCFIAMYTGTPAAVPLVDFDYVLELPAPGMRR